MSHVTHETPCPAISINIYIQVLDRFPTMDSLVESKLLLPHEAERLEKVIVLNEWNLKVLFG